MNFNFLNSQGKAVQVLGKIEMLTFCLFHQLSHNPTWNVLFHVVVTHLFQNRDFKTLEQVIY